MGTFDPAIGGSKVSTSPGWHVAAHAAGAVVASGTGGSTAAVPGRKGDVFTIAYADDAGTWGLPAQFPAAR